MLFDGDFIKHVMVSENHTKRANPNILNSSYSNCIKSFYWERCKIWKWLLNSFLHRSWWWNWYIVWFSFFARNSVASSNWSPCQTEFSSKFHLKVLSKFRFIRQKLSKSWAVFILLLMVFNGSESDLEK